MTLEQIQEMWKVDSVIDQIDLDKASLQTPSLHAKYLELLNEKRLSLKSYEVKYNQLLKTKWMWYTDKLSKEEIDDLGWSYDPFEGYNKPMKSDYSYYFNADKDLLYALKIDPDDSYALNYLAYSWLERNHKIDEAIIMLEKAYESNSDDPYIIDSIGWAYYLVNDYKKAEKFLRRAVQLMPDDQIVNDHYGDILWKLDRKIQARYFWSMVLKMKDTEKKIIDDIKNKLIEGPKNS